MKRIKVPRRIRLYRSQGSKIVEWETWIHVKYMIGAMKSTVEETRQQSKQEAEHVVANTGTEGPATRKQDEGVNDAQHVDHKHTNDERKRGPQF